MKELGLKLANLPHSPGVYIMRDEQGSVLYVGKAKNLAKRVKNYFEPGRDARNTVLLFVPKIADLETIVTDNEKEAFLLENTLIKKLKPKYNISLRDDKDFLCIRIDPKADFPRLDFVRRPKEDGAKYFGPYSSGLAIREAINSVSKIFLLRRCSDHVFANRSRPCILYQIKLCTAPCVGYISKEDYKKIAESAIRFLKGDSAEILREFRAEMKKASEEMRYEDAAKFRDKINAINASMEEQKVISKVHKDRDIFGFARQGENIVVALLTVRVGKLVGGKNFKLKSKYLADSEAFSSFLGQYYLNKSNAVPDEILAPKLVIEKELIEKGLSIEGKEVLRILTPARGEARKLVVMATENATLYLKEISSESARLGNILELATAKLQLKKKPLRIEGYDISNIQGVDAVGSMVVFSEGIPDKNSYRKFKIKFTKGPDDYAMMNEVLSRRISNQNLGPLPDLIVIDGGKGQLNVAAAILADKSYLDIDLISIAKEKIRGKDRVYDRIFVKGRKNPLTLKQDSPVLHLIARVRDEAHRFALSYHKKLRNIV
jgi:excinuclease ABC subunit C